MQNTNENKRYVRSGTKLYVNLRTGTIVKKEGRARVEEGTDNRA